MTPSERADLLKRIRANAEHNSRERGRTASYGPMVCVCPEPQADPKVNWGECSVCRRKPLGLFRVAS